MSLSWTASTDKVGVTGYNIFRNGTEVGTSTTPSYTDSGLASNATYTIPSRLQRGRDGQHTVQLRHRDHAWQLPLQCLERRDADGSSNRMIRTRSYARRAVPGGH